MDAYQTYIKQTAIIKGTQDSWNQVVVFITSFSLTTVCFDASESWIFLYILYEQTLQDGL